MKIHSSDFLERSNPLNLSWIKNYAFQIISKAFWDFHTRKLSNIRYFDAVHKNREKKLSMDVVY